MNELKNYIVTPGHRILHNGKRYVSYDVILLTEKEATRLGSKVKPDLKFESFAVFPEKGTTEPTSVEEIIEKKSKKGVKE